MKQILFVITLSSLAFSQQQSVPLTDSRIMMLAQAGVSEAELLRMVATAPHYDFDLQPVSTDAMMKAGVSEEVIKAMAARESGSAPTATVSSPQSNTVPNASGVAQNSAVVPDGAAPAVNDGRTRVFVTDSQSWEVRGGSWASGNRNGWGGGSYMAGGARPQTAEIIKTLNQRCPGITVTNNTQKADFVLVLDHEGGKGYAQRHNKIAVFNRDGDAIFSNSTRALGNAVKDACEAMLNARR